MEATFSNGRLDAMAKTLSTTNSYRGSLSAPITTQGWGLNQTNTGLANYQTAINSAVLAPKITYSQGATAGTKSYSASGLMNG